MLNQIQRDRILGKMTELQRNVLFEYKLKDRKNYFLNQIYLKDTDWEFIDYKESLHYHDKDVSKEERFFCQCGREIKYQCVLRSKKNGDLLNLSLHHLEKHTSIPKNIAKEIEQGILEFDEVLDGILQKFDKGERFPQWYKEFYQEHQCKLQISETYQERIRMFMSVNLPISSNDEWELRRKSNHYLQELEKPIVITDVSDKQFLRDIADYINSREKGEFYILRVAEYLSAKNYDGDLDFEDISQAVDILAEQFPMTLKTLSLPIKEKISDEKIII
ncbi:Uncharacterised protein [Enterococcus hirae]|uniref:hypothetical protein n=1 Tax=Enterococcus hirae TaxID=1354 RepID=UPI001024EBBF|nr:hypothetical protein [Enterococcus hirae]VFA57536.1 Uncharacterised protein [Enterococcus hirae]VTS66974.1 Uncharacterised protein [Enterococcus hirae]